MKLFALQASRILRLLTWSLALALTCIVLVANTAYAAKIGGEGAVDGGTSWSAGAAPGREIIDKTNTLSAGTVRSVSIYFNTSGTGNQTVRAKVWRQNGSNLDLVATSGDINIGAHGTGVVSVDLPTPIDVQAGDYPGIQLANGTSDIDATGGSHTILYRTGNTTSGSIAQSSFVADTAAPSIAFNDTVSPPPAVSITTIDPLGSWDDEDEFTAVVTGSGFLTGAEVRLTKTGQSDIVASSVSVDSSTQLTANLDLDGAALGLWNVVVTNLNTASSTLSSRFRIFDASSSDLGGYGAVNSDQTFNSGTAPGRDFIDKTHSLAEGTVRSASLYLTGTAGTGAVARFKVWRQNGTNLDLVGESGEISIAGLTAGAHTLALPSTISSEFGDYPGVFLSSTGTPTLDCATASSVTRYRTGNTTSGSVAESSFSSDTCAPALKLSSAGILSSVSPDEGVNTGEVALTVQGSGFTSGMTVKLAKTGESDIVASNVQIASGTSLTADFDLTGADLGAWNVIVVYQDESVASLNDGFTVTSEYLFMGIGDSIAEGHNAYHGPEHGGPSGNPLSQPWITLSEALNWDFYNAGIGGQNSSQINSRIQTLLDTHDPGSVYLIVGINDIAQSVNLNTYLSNLSSILSKVEDSGAELIISQILPDHEGSGTYIQNTKLWNASVEEWARLNGVKLAPSYLEMSSNSGTDDDELSSAYDSGDNVHLNLAGNARLGELLSYAAVPSKKVIWGAAQYPNFPNVSLKWFSLAGGASVTGNSDTGSLSLPDGATASSNVFTLPSGSKPFSIMPSVASGDVEVSYRTSSTNFVRTNSSIEWIEYDGSATISSDQFVQIRLEGASASAASVGSVEASWDTVPSHAISGVAATTTSTTATVTWTTTTQGSSIVDYGLTSSYSNSTTEADMVSRVTSHSVTMSDLPSCTTYHFRVRSRDTSLNLATGSDATFSTVCEGSAGVESESAGTINDNTGGQVEHTVGASTITLDVPASALGANATIQIKELNGDAFFLSAGAPVGVTRAGSYAIDLKALSDADTLITSFADALSVTIQYEDSDVAGLDESSLAIYRYDGSAWHALTDCSVDTASNEVTCDTMGFSVFSIFGEEPEEDLVATSSGGGGKRRGCTDIDALNYKKNVSHVQYLCKYAPKAPAATPPPSKPDSLLLTRDLSVGMEGEDVRLLQMYLIEKGYLSAGNAIGYFGPMTKAAVMQLQQKSGVNPVSGLVGPLTRAVVIGSTSTPSPAMSAQAVNFTRDLEFGLTGEDVRQLQEMLNARGYLIATSGPGAPGSETTMFGYATQAALKRYQADRGILPAAGYFGPKTRLALQGS